MIGSKCEPSPQTLVQTRMFAVQETSQIHSDRDEFLIWLVILAGACFMYVPTYWSLANGLWRTDDQAHGPIILAIVLWLVWQIRESLFSLDATPSIFPGTLLLVIGMAAYVIGRSQEILVLEVGSQVLVFGAVLLLLKGFEALWLAWFPILYLLFMIPLPGVIVDTLTGPLKQYVSVIAEQVLYSIGYPIARQGVVLHVGQYQLLVADACSGLHSMFSLSALGVLFMFLTRRASVWHNVIMLLSILPIAFLANVIRVMVLILVTYHFGDEAGQGFVHGTAGIVLLIAALICLFLLDSALALASRRKISAP